MDILMIVNMCETRQDIAQEIPRHNIIDWLFIHVLLKRSLAQLGLKLILFQCSFSPTIPEYTNSLSLPKPARNGVN